MPGHGPPLASADEQRGIARTIPAPANHAQPHCRDQAKRVWSIYGSNGRKTWTEGSKVEPACKPGSVEDSHSSGIAVTGDLKRPTRKHGGTPAALSSDFPI